jgi:hypothetical protein
MYYLLQRACQFWEKSVGIFLTSCKQRVYGLSGRALYGVGIELRFEWAFGVGDLMSVFARYSRILRGSVTKVMHAAASRAPSSVRRAGRLVPSGGLGSFAFAKQKHRTSRRFIETSQFVNTIATPVQRCVRRDGAFLTN